MKLNQDKICFGIYERNVWAKIGRTKFWKSKKQKLLGVETNRTLSFDEYIASLWKRARKK